MACCLLQPLTAKLPRQLRRRLPVYSLPSHETVHRTEKKNRYAMSELMRANKVADAGTKRKKKTLTDVLRMQRFCMHPATRLAAACICNMLSGESTGLYGFSLLLFYAFRERSAGNIDVVGIRDIIMAFRIRRFFNVVGFYPALLAIRLGLFRFRVLYEICCSRRLYTAGRLGLVSSSEMQATYRLRGRVQAQFPQRVFL